MNPDLSPVAAAPDRQVRVIGIGNEFRQDDGAGIAVARRLAHRAAGLIDVSEHHGEATSLLQAWEGARVVLVVDAVRSGAAPGTIYRFDVRSTGLPNGATWNSSHSLGLADAVTLALRWNCLPAVLLIYGIEGERFGFGAGLSPNVDKAVSAVVERLLRELGNLPVSRRPTTRATPRGSTGPREAGSGRIGSPFLPHSQR